MAQPPADNSLDTQSRVNDALMPDEDTLLDYINSCSTPPSVREITNAFKISKDRHASLRRLLCDMADRGLLAGNRRAIAAPDTLPEVTVLELINFDDNGDGMAQLAGNAHHSQPPCWTCASGWPANFGPACPDWPGAL